MQTQARNIEPMTNPSRCPNPGPTIEERWHNGGLATEMETTMVPKLNPWPDLLQTKQKFSIKSINVASLIDSAVCRKASLLHKVIINDAQFLWNRTKQAKYQIWMKKPWKNHCRRMCFKTSLDKALLHFRLDSLFKFC